MTTSKASGSQTDGKASVLQDVIDSIFKGGTRPGVITVMRTSFSTLILTLLALLIGTNFNIHVFALLLLSSGLFASTEWFTRELVKVEAQKKQK